MVALQERMSFFVEPTQEVYEGMVIGENSRADDMDVNITKEKQLTNMRQSTSDIFERMTPSRKLTLEECLEFAREDECVEVTPEIVRIRKVVLDQTERARATASRLKRQEAPTVLDPTAGFSPHLKKEEATDEHQDARAAPEYHRCALLTVALALVAPALTGCGVSIQDARRTGHRR